jgi:hypothetical protein
VLKRLVHDGDEWGTSAGEEGRIRGTSFFVILPFIVELLVPGLSRCNTCAFYFRLKASIVYAVSGGGMVDCI